MTHSPAAPRPLQQAASCSSHQQSSTNRQPPGSQLPGQALRARFRQENNNMKDYSNDAINTKHSQLFLVLALFAAATATAEAGKFCSRHLLRAIGPTFLKRSLCVYCSCVYRSAVLLNTGCCCTAAPAHVHRASSVVLVGTSTS